MRAQAIFIGVEVDDAVARETAFDGEDVDGADLRELGRDGGLPGDGAVRVLKLYDEGAPLQRV